MKKLLLFTIIALMIVGTVNAAYTDGVVSYVPFNNTANDFVGSNDFNGTASSESAFGDTWYRMNYSSDYMKGDIPFDNGDTIAMWLQGCFNDFGFASGEIDTAAQGVGFGSANMGGLIAGVYLIEDDWNVYHGYGFGDILSLVSGCTLNYSSPTHVVITIENFVPKMYYDGVELSLNLTDDGGNITNITPTTQFAFASASNPQTAYAGNYLVKDFVYYDRVISAQEVSDLYDADGVPLLAAAFSGNGSGTVGDPYVITTPSQLDEMRDNLTASYSLGNDLNMSSWGNWTPVGDWTTAFDGTFDGNNYTIHNLYIQVYNTGGNTAWGLFGAVDTSLYIKNFILDNFYMNETAGLSGECCSGAIIGGVDTDLDEFSNIHVTGDIYLPNSDLVGGLIGYTNSLGAVIQMNNLSYEGTILTNSEVAGLVAECFGVNITNSRMIGTLKATAQLGSGIGGICGQFTSSAPITASYISDSYAKVNISVNTTLTSAKITGLAGLVSIRDAFVTNSYYVGTITVGGVGSINIDNILVDISGTGNTSVTNTYYDNETNNEGSSFGTPLTTAQAKQEASYTGFDFVNTWAINEGTNYPLFLWEYTAPPINETPTIDDYNPSTYNVNISYDGTQEFNVTTSDAQNDSLSYQWYIDGSPELFEINDYYDLVAQTLGEGSYNVTVIVTDGNTNASQEWNATVEATPPATGYSPSNEANDIAPIVIDGAAAIAIFLFFFVDVIGLILIITWARAYIKKKK